MSIISPWIFYAIDILSKLQLFFKICLGITIAILVVFIMCDLSEDDKITIKCAKYFIISIIICGLGVVAIPSEETMYKMLVAKYVTYENIDKATESIKDGVDYIFEKLDKE